jgi:hypothetical protein
MHLNIAKPRSSILSGSVDGPPIQIAADQESASQVAQPNNRRGVSVSVTLHSARQSTRVFDDADLVRDVLPAIFIVLVPLWIMIVAIRGLILTGHTLSERGEQILLSPAAAWAVFCIMLACLAAALVARLTRPAATVPASLAAGIVVVTAGAVMTDSVPSIVGAIALFTGAWLLGDMLVQRSGPSDAPAAAQVPVALGLGLGFFGLTAFILAAQSLLGAQSVLAVAIVIVIVAVLLDYQSIRQRLRHLDLRDLTPSWFETALVGLTVGFVSFALLAAFAPENMSDPFRQHLPIAREIWQSGSVQEFPWLGVSRDPVQAHLYYAVAYGFGGITTAKLVHTFVGLVAILGVAGLGWVCAGRLAAYAGAAIFGTMTVVVWELGHAYTDLFPALFTVTALLCILFWQRTNRTAWLVSAGVLSGVGTAAKLNTGLIVAALALAIFLVGRAPWRWRDRIVAGLAFGLGAVVVVPWLLRTYLITSTLPAKLLQLLGFVAAIIPGLSIPVQTPTDPGFSSIDLQGLGIGHSFFDLIGVPWLLTFDADRYGNSTLLGGDVGIVLLMVLPLALLGPRTRAMAVLALTMLVSYVGWWLTPLQNVRHLLPTLAIASALAGVGVASAVVSGASGPRRVLSMAVPGGVVLGLLIAPVFVLTGVFTQMPIDFIIGRETAAQYVQHEVPAAVALAGLDGRVAPDEPVAYVGKWGGAQLYTEAKLVNMGQFTQESITDELGTTPDEVLASLSELGISYVVWDRPVTKPEDWRSTLLSTDFLQQHGRILAGDQGAYLFQILPDSDAPWGMNRLRNLLQDSDFEKVRKVDEPWSMEGDVRARSGLVALRPNTSVQQTVTTAGGSPYLFTANGQCTNPEDTAVLTMRWLDPNGNELLVASEEVIPGVVGSNQFLWRMAPENAASVLVELAAAESGARCEFHATALYKLS